MSFFDKSIGLAAGLAWGFAGLCWFQAHPCRLLSYTHGASTGDWAKTYRPKAKTSVGVHFRTQRKVSQSLAPLESVDFPLSAKKTQKTPSTHLRQKVIIFMSNIHFFNPLFQTAHRSKYRKKNFLKTLEFYFFREKNNEKLNKSGYSTPLCGI